MKYFISDCHVMDGNPSDEFNLKSEYFVSMINKIREEKVGDEVQELILLGDIIDFLEIHCEGDIPESASYNDIALFQLERRVFPAHPEIFDAISNFLSENNSIFYVWGNHDYPLRFGNVNEALAQRILPKTRDRTDYGKFTVADYYLSHKMLIYAEHGHRFDLYNVHRDGHQPVGATLVRDFIRKWSQKCYSGKARDMMGDQVSPEVMSELGVECGDGTIRPLIVLRSIRPRGNIFKFIERLMRYGVLDSEDEKELISDLSNALSGAGLPTQAKLISFTSQLGLKQLRDTILKARFNDDTPRVLRKAARDIFKNTATSQDLDYVPRICIMGHSHFSDARIWPNEEFIQKVENYPLDPEKNYYFNLGSWMNLCLVNDSGLPGTHYRVCPYLRLKKESDGTVIADLRDAKCPKHSHIDIEKHRALYLEYNTAYE